MSLDEAYLDVSARCRTWQRNRDRHLHPRCDPRGDAAHRVGRHREDTFADIAFGLRARVDLPATTRYRLVGAGLSGFIEPDGSRAQDDLFA